MTKPSQRIHNDYRQSEARPTCDTAIYAAGDVIGTKMEFRGLIVGDHGAAKLQYAQLVERSAQEVQIDLVLFNQDISTGSTITDNDAIALSDADANNIMGVVTFASYVSFSTGQSLSNRSALHMPIHVRGDEIVYGVLVSRATPTFESTDELQIRLGVERD